MDGHVLDLAPTILQLGGASIPSHLEGKPLPIVCSTLGAPEQLRSEHKLGHSVKTFELIKIHRMLVWNDSTNSQSVDYWLLP